MRNSNDNNILRKGNILSASLREDSLAFSRNKESLASVLEEVSESQRYIKSINRQNLTKLVKQRKQHRMEVFTKFIFYIVSNVFNIVSVLLYMFQTLFDNPHSEYYNETVTLNLEKAEFVVTVYFVIELFFSFYYSGKSLKFFLSTDSILDLVTIVPSCISFFSSDFNVNIQFIRIFRIFRIFRLFRIYKSLRLIKLESEVEGVEGFNFKINPKKLQLSILLIVLICFFFLGAGIILAVQSFSPKTFSTDYMNFFDAVYFIVVTTSTLGYGNIYPNTFASRMVVILVLFSFFIVVSDQLTKLSNLLRFWGDGVISFDGTDHYILVCDKSISLLSFVQTLRSFDDASQILVITKDNIQIESREYPFDRIILLKTASYEVDVFHAANAKKAKAIFIFASKNLKTAIQNEKVTDYITLKILQYLGTASVPMYVQSLYSEVNPLGSRKLSTFYKQIPSLLIRNMLISKCAFIPGFGAFMQNLLFNNFTTNDWKIEGPVTSQYLKGCKHQIIIRKLPKYFKRCTFFKAMAEIYSESIDDYFVKVLSDTLQSMNPVLMIGLFERRKSRKPSENNIFIYPGNMKIRPTMSGIFICSSEAAVDKILSIFDERMEIEEVETGKTVNFAVENNKMSLQSSENEISVKINNYLTEREDSRKNSQADFSFESANSNRISKKGSARLVTVESTPIKRNPVSKASSKNVTDMTKENLDFLKNFEVVYTQELQQEVERYARKFYSGSTSSMGFFALGIEKRVIDVEKDSQVGRISKHILIIGHNDNMSTLLFFLSNHFPNREVCIVHNSLSAEISHKLLRQFSFLKIFKADALNPHHLVNCGIRQCERVLLISENLDERTREDINNMIVFRSLQYFFDVKVTVEIWDSRNTNLIGCQASIDSIKVNEFLHPLFMGGDVILSDLLEQLPIFCHSNLDVFNTWVKLLSAGYINSKMGKSGFDATFNNQFPVILSIPVPSEYNFKEYHKLTTDLLTLEQPCLSLGLHIGDPMNYLDSKFDGKVNNLTKFYTKMLKITTSHKKKLSKLVQEEDKPYLNNIKNAKKKKINLDYIDFEKTHLPVFLTNPPPGFKMMPGCSVTILYQHVPAELNRASRIRESELNNLTRTQSESLIKIRERYKKCTKMHKNLTRIINQAYEDSLNAILPLHKR